MAITSWPRVSEDTTDAQYAQLFTSIIGSGVRSASNFAVTVGVGLVVNVSAGFAVVAGNAINSTASEALTIAANSTSNPRIDTVVLRRDFSQPAGQVVRLIVKQGTPAVSPVPPTLDSSETGNRDFPLADVRVAAGAATLTSANLTDRRTYLSARVGLWTTATRPTDQATRFGLNTETGVWEYASSTAGWTPIVSWSTIPGKPSAVPVAEGGTGSTTAAGARTNLGAAPTSHTHPWSQITSTPATFPPSAHSHSWTETTGKPSTFPPSAHTHSAADITSGTLPITRGGTGAATADAALAALGGSPAGHSHAWGEVTGKPSTFSPSAHTHSASDITSGTLPVSLGGTGSSTASGARANLGAAAESHSHAWGDITGKPSTYTPSTHGHSLADANITGTLPLNQGGTGATTAAAALQALGIYVQASAPAHANGRVWIKRP